MLNHLPPALQSATIIGSSYERKKPSGLGNAFPYIRVVPLTEDSYHESGIPRDEYSDTSLRNMDDLSSNNRAGVSYSATRPAKQYPTRICEKGFNIMYTSQSIIKGAEITVSTQSFKAKAFVFPISLLFLS